MEKKMDTRNVGDAIEEESTMQEPDCPLSKTGLLSSTRVLARREATNHVILQRDSICGV